MTEDMSPLGQKYSMFGNDKFIKLLVTNNTRYWVCLNETVKVPQTPPRVKFVFSFDGKKDIKNVGKELSQNYCALEESNLQTRNEKYSGIYRKKIKV